MFSWYNFTILMLFFMNGYLGSVRETVTSKRLSIKDTWISKTLKRTKKVLLVSLDYFPLRIE